MVSNKKLHKVVWDPKSMELTLAWETPYKTTAGNQLSRLGEVTTTHPHTHTDTRTHAAKRRFIGCLELCCALRVRREAAARRASWATRRWAATSLSLTGKSSCTSSSSTLVGRHHTHTHTNPSNAGRHQSIT